MTRYENYPLLYVLAANLVTLPVYLLGALIISGFETFRREAKIK